MGSSEIPTRDLGPPTIKMSMLSTQTSQLVFMEMENGIRDNCVDVRLKKWKDNALLISY